MGGPELALFPLSEPCEAFIERHFKRASPRSNSDSHSHLLPIQVLCSDLGVPLSSSFFALSYKFNAVERHFFSRQEFIRGLRPLIDSPWKLQQALAEAEAFAALNVEPIYLFAFKLLKETEFQKLLPIPYAIEAMKVLISNYPHTAAFTKFLQQQTQYTGLNYDQWLMFFLFSKTIAPDFAEYHVDDAWPVLIDDFVVHMTSRAAHEQEEGAMEMNYPTGSQQFQYSPPSRYLVPPSSPSSPRSPSSPSACVERVAISGVDEMGTVAIRSDAELLLSASLTTDSNNTARAMPSESVSSRMQFLDPAPTLARYEKSAVGLTYASPTKLRHSIFNNHDSRKSSADRVEESLWHSLSGANRSSAHRPPRQSYAVDQLDMEDDEHVHASPSRAPTYNDSPRNSRPPSVQCSSVLLFRHLTHLENVAARTGDERSVTQPVAPCPPNDATLDIVASDDLGMDLC